MLTREEFEIMFGPVSDALFEFVTNQQGTIAELVATVKELQDRIDKNSGNSSKPPSSDGYKKKPVTLRMKSGNRPGGQKGHPGRTLEFSEKPDHVIPHKPQACSCCGEDLTDAPTTLKERRQVFDVPPVQLECTEHQAYQVRCPRCGENSTADFPQEVRGAVQYGPRFSAQMLYMSGYQMIPSARVCEMASDIFGASLSEGTLFNLVERASETLEPIENEIKEALTKSAVTHHDETGARVEGSLHWVHVVCSVLLTVYACSKKRGKAGMETLGVIGNAIGTAVHDGWKPYFSFSGKHALCNAHHLRELKGIYEQLGQQWAADMIRVLLDAKAAVERAVQNGDRRVHPLIERELESRYRKAVADGYKMNPPPESSGKRGRTKDTPAGNLLRRLSVYQKETLAFLYDFDIPFDNNQAERDIRMIKVKQKVSGCFRSKVGADNFCRIRGYISTMRKQGHNVLAVLASVYSGAPTKPEYNA